MNVVYFTHSLRSCWNHGNAHFVRGVLRELADLGHHVRALEPDGAWSLANLLADHGPGGLDAFHEAYPELSPEIYASHVDPAMLLGDADLVIVHEWNDPALVGALGAWRKAGGRALLLFHDTHHRAVTDPDAIRAFDLSGYDGVLAFGEALSEVYRGWGWGARVSTWHEAADTRLFHPPQAERGKGDTAPRGEWPIPPRHGLVWIGNWGDDERSAELTDYLFAPAQALGISLDVYGVRYPSHALGTLARFGARYHGWLPNPRAPEVFARHMATVHVPRRAYVQSLPGIPTIRVFEALACGIPLLSAPWDDHEGLFRVGHDFLMAATPAAMDRNMRELCGDPALRETLAASGLETIRARHTCRHRAHELLATVAAWHGERAAA